MNERWEVNEWGGDGIEEEEEEEEEEEQNRREGKTKSQTKGEEAKNRRKIVTGKG